MSDEQKNERAGSAFDALMARRNGEPLPEPTCPHLSRDHEGNCWACVYDERERAMKAEAWREGAAAGHHSPLTWFALRQCNPYKVATPPRESDNEHEEQP